MHVLYIGTYYSGLLRKCMGPNQTMISHLVKLELAYINTSHPDFIGGSRAVAQLMDRNTQQYQQQYQQQQQFQQQQQQQQQSPTFNGTTSANGSRSPTVASGGVPAAQKVCIFNFYCTIKQYKPLNDYVLSVCVSIEV